MNDHPDLAMQVTERLIPDIALAIVRHTDPDERAILARAFPDGITVRWDATPDGPVFVVEMDLRPYGRPVAPLMRVTGLHLLDGFPAELRAELAQSSAAAAAELPSAPDDLSALLDEM